MAIGVLALQGAFMEHIKVLAKLGAESREIRQLSDWSDDLDGLVIPGGESTVIDKLLRELDLLPSLRRAVLDGMPTFGTCAGLILLAKSLIGQEPVGLLSMDICARRNAYGRQLGSFAVRADFAGLGDIPMVFIRAPYIESVQNKAEVLSVVYGHVVAARQDNMLVTSFHPELTDNTLVHEYFMSMVDANREKKVLKPAC